MDPRLAEIYGTNEADELDLEKVAAAELAEGLAEDDELDLEGLDADQLEALAAEVLDSDEESDEESEEDEDESEEDEDGVKLAEADYLGRVMAHAYVQELREIEKTAGKSGKAAKRAAGMANPKGRSSKSSRAQLQGLRKTMKEPHPTSKVNKKINARKPEGKSGTIGKGGGSLSGKAQMAFGKAKGALKNLGHRAAETGRKGAELAKKYPGRAAGIAGGGLVAAALAGRASKGSSKEKSASALETLAEQRALEILEANGIGFESESGDEYDELSSAVESRAYEMLAEEGYEFDDSDSE